MAGTTSYDSITSGSDVIATYDVEGVNGTFSGNVSGVDGTFTGSANIGAGPLTISGGTGAPTHNARRGSLYSRYDVSGATGSDVANAALYMNVSASAASGSVWKLLNALTTLTG